MFDCVGFCEGLLRPSLSFARSACKDSFVRWIFYRFCFLLRPCNTIALRFPKWYSLMVRDLVFHSANYKMRNKALKGLVCAFLSQVETPVPKIGGRGGF